VSCVTELSLSAVEAITTIKVTNSVEKTITNFVGHCTQNAFVFGEQTPCSTNQSARPLN
jgi:hypothetical protein